MVPAGREREISTTQTNLETLTSVVTHMYRDKKRIFGACNLKAMIILVLALPDPLDAFPSVPFHSVTPSNLALHSSCAICLDVFAESSDVKQLPDCHHVFHTPCLTEWLLHHGTCPMCRTLVPSRQPAINPWMQPFFPIDRPPIKTAHAPLPISTSTVLSSHSTLSSMATPHLPHFDSQTHVDRSESSTHTD